MRRNWVRVLCGSCIYLALMPGWALGGPVLSPTDPILAIDVDSPSSRSNYPGAEGPTNALDDLDFTKYLNFGRRNSGLIITPAAGATTVGSMIFRTANDEPARDPASWRLYGTNDPISSLDNSAGDAENWTLINFRRRQPSR